MKNLIISASIILSVLAGSCTRERTADKVIGVCLLTRGHVFYKDLESSLFAEATKYNYELVVTTAEFDLGKQIGQIEDFIARDVDAILVCPVDSKGIGTGILKANDAGIPVFTADIAAEGGVTVCHIASDNVAGGQLAGDFLAKILRGKGKVAIINHPAVTSVLDRVQGFRSALKPYKEISIVADVSGQGVRDKAMQAAADVLQAHQSLDAIFGINDDSALGALDAIEQFKRKDIIVVGYDATPAAVDAIKRGTALKADVVQYPEKIGRTTMRTIADFFSGKQIPPTIPVEVGIVDKAFYEQTAQEAVE